MQRSVSQQVVVILIDWNSLNTLVSLEDEHRTLHNQTRLESAEVRTQISI